MNIPHQFSFAVTAIPLFAGAVELAKAQTVLALFLQTLGLSLCFIMVRIYLNITIFSMRKCLIIN